MNGAPPGSIYRSSVFSAWNVYTPLVGAVVIVIMLAVTPTDLPGTDFARASGVVAIVVVLAAAVIFRRLDVTFDGREIVLAYTFIKKRIPIERVYTVERYDIKWWRFGGTGIRFTGGGWAWITGSGPGAKIETTRGITYANCADPERLAALVEEYKTAHKS